MFFIWLSVDKHLSWFHVLTIVNYASLPRRVIPTTSAEFGKLFQHQVKKRVCFFELGMNFVFSVLGSLDLPFDQRKARIRCMVWFLVTNEEMQQ